MAGYLPAAAAERAAQYAALGLSGPEALYRDVPESVRLTAPLNLPPPQSELEARRTLEALAEQNLRFRSRHMATASAAAEAPSYTEALAASRPVSSQIMVWNSKMDWSTPWLISA